MPDYDSKRANPFPHPTATDVERAPGDRETKAARNIISRNITGIPKRGYMLGENDSAPILQGIKELTRVCYMLLDEIADSECNGRLGDLPQELLDLLEDHRCPDTPPMETNVG